MRIHAHSSSAGFSLVELMVGLAIGFITLLACFQALYSAEGEARGNRGSAEMHSQAILAMSLIQRDVRRAGYGVVTRDLYDCNVSTDIAAGAEAFSLRPVRVGPSASGGTNASRLTVISSSSVTASATRSVDATVPAGTSRIVLAPNRFGVAQNDLLVLGESGNPDCVLARVTGVPAVDPADRLSGQSLSVVRSSGPSYSAAARVVNLGPTPTVAAYDVDNRGLFIHDGLTGVDSIVAPLVVGLQLRFIGKDVDLDGYEDIFLDYQQNPTSWTQWTTQLAALEVAVLVRSAHRRRPTETAPCATAFLDDHGNRWRSLDVNAPEVACRDLATYSAVIPLRNLLWRPE